MTNTQRIEEYVRNRMRELNEEMANLRLSVDSEADRYFDIKERLNELSRLWDSVIRL